MAAFDTSVPTTELEAVNTMLIAIGQQPLPVGTNLTTETNATVVMALNVLSKSAREVLTEGWKFNSRYGFELTPDAQYVWTDHAGKETTLNVFKPPVGFLSWELTVCPENGDLDMIVAPSVGYRELGQPVQVLFDRTYNRDGADAQRYTGVYIDGIVAVPFEEMPESARRYISVKAARQFSAQT